MKRGVLMVVVVGIVVAIASAGIWYSQAQAGDTGANPSNIVVSEFENREFQAYQLDNGLQVLLVSDPGREKAAAAMNVAVGSWSDPDEIPGMAHFLEHMLFLGTEKYPKVDEYHSFVEQNGGSDNAYTGPENTLYYFDITAAQLEPALDRFAQFFIAPLFDEEYTQREINAVHSEFTASLQNDSRRRDDVLREVYNPEHPASRLTIGNRETLDHPELREKMRQFYRQHYVAERLSLVVYGPQRINELKSWVGERFNGVRSVDSEVPVFNQPLFETAQLPLQVEVQPRRESRLLELRFPVPGNLAQRSTKPHEYIAHLLGNEASEGLAGQLKEQGWIDSLNVYSGGVSASRHTFQVRLELTLEGLENWQSVAGQVFEYLKRIQEDGLQSWRHEELSKINTINFKFAEQVEPAVTVQRLAERLRLYDSENALRGPYLFEAFNPEEIRQWLGYLKPDNALVVLMHPDATSETESRWYQTPYSVTPLSGNAVAEWRTANDSGELSLPEPNPFIPQDLTVLEMEAPQSALYENTPQVVAMEPGYTLWHEQDDRFRTPKLDLTLLLETPLVQAGPKEAVIAELYLDLIDDALTEIRYQAGQAGSGYGLSRTQRGLQLRLYGYSDRLPVLFDTLLVELAEHKVDPERFVRLKTDLERRLSNTGEDPILNQMVRQLSEFLVRGNATPDEMLTALAEVEPEDVLAFRKQWLADSKLTMLVHGNALRENAIALGERAGAMLTPAATAPTVRPEVALLPNRRYRHEMNINHPDSALLGYFQGDNSSLRSRALFLLLGQMASAPYFAELRTREQLGYIVFAREYSFHDLPGLAVFVQSPSTDPALLQLYSDRFMTRYLQVLRSMDGSEFRAFKDGLINRLTVKEQNLYELSQRYWQAILEGNPHFNTQQRLAGEVEAISQDGFVRFFQNSVIDEDTQRLVLHQVGAGMTEDYDEHGDNLIGFYPAQTPSDLHENVTWVHPTFNNLDR